MPNFKKFGTELKKTNNIQILPLIDVIFFLLVFFMLFTTFRDNPEGLEINLPQADTATEQEEELEFNITIADDGRLFVDDRLVEEEALKSEIEEAIAESEDTLFLIGADGNVAYNYVVLVMDMVRDAGGYRLALAAEKENQN